MGYIVISVLNLWRALFALTTVQWVAIISKLVRLFVNYLHLTLVQIEYLKHFLKKKHQSIWSTFPPILPSANKNRIYNFLQWRVSLCGIFKYFQTLVCCQYFGNKFYFTLLKISICKIWIFVEFKPISKNCVISFKCLVFYLVILASIGLLFCSQKIASQVYCTLIYVYADYWSVAADTKV